MHTQSREALNHLAYTIAAGGSGPRLRDGAVKQPSKMPGRPNSRGRLSLNFLTDPQRSTKIRGNNSPGKTGKGFSPPEKKAQKIKKKKERRVELCVGRVSLSQLCKDCLSWGCGREEEALSSMSC